MLNKNVINTVLFILAVSLLSFGVMATSVEVEYVKVNGEEINQDGQERVDLTDDLDVKVRLYANTSAEDIEVSGRISGYEYSDKGRYNSYDVVNVDTLDEGDYKSINLDLEVPKDAEKDNYELVVEIYSRDGINAKYEATLNIQGEDNYVDIQRVSFDPPAVVAGRALRTRVRLENLGEEDEDDVYVKVAIPALGSDMYVTADIDELETEDLVTSEDLLLRIPECTEPGAYDVVVTAEYDDGYETTQETHQIVVKEGLCPEEEEEEEATDRTVITPPSSQEIVAGSSGTSFPIIIKNDGSEDKTYMVSVSGESAWGSAEASDSAPFVRAGNTEVVHVYLTADEQAVGRKTFVISVSDGEQSKDMTVNTRILPAEEKAEESIDWKQWLYVGVIVLLVLIVILGLIMAFKKSGNDNEEEYY